MDSGPFSVKVGTMLADGGNAGAAGAAGACAEPMHTPP